MSQRRPAKLALEDGTQRRIGVLDMSNDAQNALAVGALPGIILQGPDAGALTGVAIGDYAAHQVPDIVGSLRVDQAWGSAQISAAAHQIRGGYYGNNTTGAGATVLGINGRLMYQTWLALSLVTAIG